MTKQAIGIGSVANDGTGDTLRDAMDKVNDNFTEVYNDVDALQAAASTPVAGSVDAIRAAVKYLIVKEQYAEDLFYVKKIENGVAGSVIVEVYRTTALGSAGNKVMEYNVTSAAKTGLARITLATVGIYGLWGYMVIDWDAITAGVSYTASDWSEGGIFAVNTMKLASGGGGNGTENLLVFTDDTADADGGYDQYVFNGSADKSLTLEEFANLRGTVRVNNISDTYHVTVYAHADEQATSKFNDVAREGVIVEPGTYIEVACLAEAEFIVKGAFTVIV